jgi:hypothetical protein
MRQAHCTSQPPPSPSSAPANNYHVRFRVQDPGSGCEGGCGSARLARTGFSSGELGRTNSAYVGTPVGTMVLTAPLTQGRVDLSFSTTADPRTWTSFSVSMLVASCNSRSTTEPTGASFWCTASTALVPPASQGPLSSSCPHSCYSGGVTALLKPTAGTAFASSTSSVLVLQPASGCSCSDVMVSPGRLMSQGGPASLSVLAPTSWAGASASVTIDAAMRWAVTVNGATTNLLVSRVGG